jgi:ATP-dependent Clp protease ATP-binding subunit ClpB
MSEYQEKHSVSRLCGAPPGYVGYEEGGQLTEAVRRQPYAVLLFDEVEKACADIWNVFLQVLDDGRLTDGLGRTVDFSNTVIILTSNLGSQYLLKAMEEHPNAEQVPQEAIDLVHRTIRGHFRAEFLNRLDDIVVFKPLSSSQLSSVLRLQLRNVQARLSQRDITLEADDKALSLVLARAYNPIYGARPIARYLEKHVVTELSRMLVRDELRDNSHVIVTECDGKLVFQSSQKKQRTSTRTSPRMSPRDMEIEDR